MTYNITIMRKNCTSGSMYSFSILRILFWGILLSLLILPFVLYYVISFHLAPSVFSEEIVKLTSENKSLIKKSQEIELKANKLEKENITLKKDLELESTRRAEAETRVGIAENARSSTALQVEGLEDKIDKLKTSLSFYEELVRPASEVDALQCFNIKLDYVKGKLIYAINFLRTDQNNKNKFKSDIVLRVLTGSSALSLDEDKAAESERRIKLSMIKSKVVKGRISVDLPEDGLRILDIKAYDKVGDAIGHCWKSF